MPFAVVDIMKGDHSNVFPKRQTSRKLSLERNVVIESRLKISGILLAGMEPCCHSG